MTTTCLSLSSVLHAYTQAKEETVLFERQASSLVCILNLLLQGMSNPIACCKRVMNGREQSNFSYLKSDQNTFKAGIQANSLKQWISNTRDCSCLFLVF